MSGEGNSITKIKTQEFSFEGSVYKLEVLFEEVKRADPFIQLPDGRHVKLTKWFPTNPPRPMRVDVFRKDRLTEKILEEAGVLQAILVLEALPPRIIDKPLKLHELQEFIRSQRLRILIKINFEEIFTWSRQGFIDWIENQILHDNIPGRLRDVKFRLLEVDEYNDITIEVDSDARSFR